MQPRTQQERCPMRFPGAIPQQAAAGCRAQGWNLLWQSQLGSPPEMPPSAGTRMGPGDASISGQWSPLVLFSKPPNASRKTSCSSPDISFSKLQGKQIYLNYKAFRNQTMAVEKKIKYMYVCVCVCKCGIESYSLSHTWRFGCNFIS